MNNKVITIGCSAALLLAAVSLRAQVPQMISYQGRVAVGGTNFTGTGQFKFALLDAGVTNAGGRATATASVTGGSIYAITVVQGGSNYITTPRVTITDTTGSNAVAVAVLAGGVVSSVQVQSGGQHYSSSPTVTIARPPTWAYNQFWSNDGSSANGEEPSAAVPLPVSGGLFNVLLGDTTLSNMLPISPAIFANPDVRLRIWFNDGARGFAQLDPDQRIASVGYAMIASTVTDGAITSAQLAPGAVTSSNLSSNAVQASSISTNAVGTDQLANGAATAAKIAPNAVGTIQLTNGAVTTAKLADGGVASGKLAAQAVHSTNLANSAVGANQLTNTAVSTAKLADAAVTTLKLADAAVTSLKLATQSVQSANIAYGAVGSAQLSSDVIGGVDQVLRGMLYFSNSTYQASSTLSATVVPAKCYVILSDPVQNGSGSGTAPSHAMLVSLTTTNLTVAVDNYGSTLPPMRVSYQVIQSK